MAGRCAGLTYSVRIVLYRQRFHVTVLFSRGLSCGQVGVMPACFYAILDLGRLNRYRDFYR